MIHVEGYGPLHWRNSSTYHRAGMIITGLLCVLQCKERDSGRLHFVTVVMQELTVQHSLESMVYFCTCAIFMLACSLICEWVNVPIDWYVSRKKVCNHFKRCLIAYGLYGMAECPWKRKNTWCVSFAIHVASLLSVLQAVSRTCCWWSTCARSGLPINASGKA